MWLLDRYDRYDRYGFDLSGNVASTVNKAKEYLADNQPGPAALVLDALTVVLLPTDNERYTLIVGNATFLWYKNVIIVIIYVELSMHGHPRTCSCLIGNTSRTYCAFHHHNIIFAMDSQ